MTDLQYNTSVNNHVPMPMHWISQRYYQAIRCVFTYRRNTVSTKWHILVIMNNYTLTLLLCNCRGPLCSVFLFRLLFSSVFFSPLLFLSLQPENTWEMMTWILKNKMSQAPKALDCEPNPQLLLCLHTERYEGGKKRKAPLPACRAGARAGRWTARGPPAGFCWHNLAVHRTQQQH